MLINRLRILGLRILGHADYCSSITWDINHTAYMAIDFTFQWSC